MCNDVIAYQEYMRESEEIKSKFSDKKILTIFDPVYRILLLFEYWFRNTTMDCDFQMKSIETQNSGKTEVLYSLKTSTGNI